MTKEVKYYFKHDNHLNKGYGAENAKLTKLAEGLKNNWPEPEVLAAYEEVFPGTMHKLLTLAEKEQMHQHNLDLRNLSLQRLGKVAGQISAVAMVALLCNLTFKLALFNLNYGIIFAGLAFVSILSLLFLTRKCNNAAIDLTKSSQTNDVDNTSSRKEKDHRSEHRKPIYKKKS